MTGAAQPRGDLVALDNLRRLLARTTNPVDLKSLRDKAEALRKYIKSAELGLENQNRAAEVKLRAERKAGQALADLGLRGGSRKSPFPKAALKNSASPGTSRSVGSLRRWFPMRHSSSTSVKQRKSTRN